MATNKTVEQLAEEAHDASEMTKHDIAVYETRIGYMEAIMTESGYFGLLKIVRDAVRRNLAEDGQSIEYSDAMMARAAQEAVREP